MPRRKNKPAPERETYEERWKRYKREQRAQSRMIQKAKESEDCPIAFWDHDYGCYQMDSLPGRYEWSNNTRLELVAAYDAWTMQWKTYRRLSDDEVFKRIMIFAEDHAPF